jgi:NAD(P)-dependent dehydrogenase (short-subunit alcohol dehydrogenase family)
MRLSDQVAVITGATSGIGRGIAQVFVRKGAKVVIVGRDRGAGEDLAGELAGDGGEAAFVACDVSVPEDVARLAREAEDQFGKVTCLVNCAGIGVYKPIAETDVKEMDQILSVNLRGYMLTTRHFVPVIKRAGGGSIVNISSVHAMLSSPADAPYAATKGGIDALTRSTAIDEAPTIRVNAIRPGWVESSLTKGIFEDLSTEDVSAAGIRRLIESEQPMDRIGSPEDIGEAAAFLASPAASFITGAFLTVDGGLTAFLERWDRTKIERLASKRL